MRGSATLVFAPLLGAWAASIPGSDTTVRMPVGDAREIGTGAAPSRQVFSLGEEPNENFKGGDAVMEMIRAYTKFTQAIPPWLAEIVESNPEMNNKFRAFLGKADDDKGLTSTVSATPPPLLDLEYVVPVDIGTPPQRVRMNLDTGSADLWTFSTDTYMPHVNGQKLYRPNDSDTSSLVQGQSWSVKYGDGASASGIVYKDRVSVGKTFFKEQAVQSAVTVSQAIAQDSFLSGILGMSFSKANTVRPTQQKTYMENIQDELADKVFTANLQKGGPGNYNFGYIDKSEYTGDIKYAPVKEDSKYWEVSLTGFRVGDGKFQENKWDVIVDTGTTLLLAPVNVVNAYYSQVKGAVFDSALGMIVFPCSTHLPDFEFGIDEYRGKVPGHYISYSQYKPNRCFGGIQSSGNIGMTILGDIVLKAQFVVFDMANRTVGFANKKTKAPGPTKLLS